MKHKMINAIAVVLAFAYVARSAELKPALREKFNGVKYIRLEKNGAIISLAEVQVFVNGKNVATNGAASQSSFYIEQADASKAIDGKTDGDFASGSVTHTAESGDNNPWWELALSEASDISQIVVWNRTDCCMDRLDGVKLQLLNSSRMKMYESVIQNASGKADLHYAPVKGVITLLSSSKP